MPSISTGIFHENYTIRFSERRTAPIAESIDLDGITVRTLPLEGQTVRDKDVMDRMVLQMAIEAAK